MGYRINSHKIRERVIEERKHMIVPKEILDVRSPRKRKNTIGVTQEELAQLAELSPSEIQKIEQGDRRLTEETAETLAYAFGIRPEYLLCEDNFRTYKQYEEHLRIQEALEESRSVREYAKPVFNTIIQNFLRQGQDKGQYTYKVLSSQNGEAFDYVVSNEIVSVVLEESYIDNLRDEVIDYLSFKLNRHIRGAIAEASEEYLNK